MTPRCCRLLSSSQVWPLLTVEEHLSLFAELKGVPESARTGCVQAIAAAVKLDGDAFRQPATALSGGMKRRLSLGIALIADPKIVVADEPTTGLDPETRRGVWDILEAERAKGRAILLTTHSMVSVRTNL